MPVDRKRPRHVVLLVLLALMAPCAVALTATDGPLSAVGLSAAPANAGTYAVDYCGATSVADGWTTSATAPATASFDCRPGGGGLGLYGNLPSQSWGQGSQVTFIFTAPDGTSISSWSPHLNAQITQANGASDTFRLNAGAIPSSTYPVTCVNESCDGTNFNGSYGAFTGARQLQEAIVCTDESPDATLCNRQGTLIDTGGQVVLNDPSAPELRGNIAGPLPNASTPPNALRGAVSIGAQVVDSGSGVASTELRVDGAAVARAGNGCTPQPTTQRVPCSLSQAATVNWDSTGVADGGHDATLVGVDASGNEATLWQGRVLVANHPIGPGSPDELRGPTTAAAASDTVKLTGSFPSTRKAPPKSCKRSSYRKRHAKVCKGRPAVNQWKGSYSRKKTVTVTGRLTTPSGQTIANAPVRVAGTTIRGGGHWQADVTTNGNGRWTAKVPRDVGALDLVISTRARLYDEVPAATTTASLGVRSALTLHVSRTRLRPGARVRFTGHLDDRAAGVPIALEVRYRGKWRVFDATQSKANGTFASSYRFAAGGPGSYRFRARSKPTKATPYPYLANTSGARSVRVR